MENTLSLRNVKVELLRSRDRSAADQKLQDERRKKDQDKKNKAWEERKKNLKSVSKPKYKSQKYSWLK